MSGVLDPAGPQAGHIADLWWLMLIVCAVVFIAVLAVLGWALKHAPRSNDAAAPNATPAAARERRAGWIVKIAVAVSSLFLIALLVASVMTDRALARLSLDNALTVHITAYQWWWDVTYDDPQPGQTFRTANELYIPVGRPVVITLDARDVIHSFWVPSLHGKKDLIPGRTSTIMFRADKAGEWRAACVEFCGLQHAFMSLDVVALTPESFESWVEAQRKPAAEPADRVAQRGRELFVAGSCMLCHSIQGTSAQARSAPDLTHIASRAHLAAGALPNTPQSLAAWIIDPQKIKPGANMPAHLLPSDDLNALLAYLGTLK